MNRPPGQADFDDLSRISFIEDLFHRDFVLQPAADADVLAESLDLNVMKPDRLPQTRHRLADGGGPTRTEDLRGDVDANLIDQAILQEGNRHVRAALDQDLLNAAVAQIGEQKGQIQV
jgi:hypothetical protein